MEQHICCSIVRIYLFHCWNFTNQFQAAQNSASLEFVKSNALFFCILVFISVSVMLTIWYPNYATSSLLLKNNVFLPPWISSFLAYSDWHFERNKCFYKSQKRQIGWLYSVHWSFTKKILDIIDDSIDVATWHHSSYMTL